MYYYYVAMSGVYMQGVYFISDDVALAKAEAEKLAKADVDNYHTWDVYNYHSGTKESHLYYQFNKQEGSRYQLPGEAFTEWEKFR